MGGTLFEDVVGLTCAAGYEGNPPDLVCGSSLTWSAPTGCELIMCDEPSQTGYTFQHSGNFNVDQTVTTTCANNYEGTGTSVTCLSNGEWSLATGCTELGCGYPLQTGYSFTVGSTDIGESATAVCASGYGGTASSVECMWDTQWTQATGCVPLDCPAPSQTGYVFQTGDSFYTSERNSSCGTGYEIAANSDWTNRSVVCQSDQSWTQASGCAVVDCGSPANVSGYVTADGASTYQAIRTVSCAEGYAVAGTLNVLSCTAEGLWTAPGGCAVKDCGSSLNTAYTYGTVTDTTYGSTVTVTGCSANYEYDGVEMTTELTCGSNGAWSGITGCVPLPEFVTLVLPQVVSAQFSDSVSRLIITFDIATNTPADSSCATLLHADSLSGYGEGYSCNWNSATELSVTMGNNPTVTLTDTVSILGGIISSSSGNGFMEASSTPVLAPETTLVVTAVVSGSEIVGVCDDIILAAESSTGNGGRTFSYSWHMVEENNPGLSNAEFSAVRDYLANITSATATVPNSILLTGEEYVFTLKVINWLGGADETDFTVTRLTIPVPRIVLSTTDLVQSLDKSYTVTATGYVPEVECVDTVLSSEYHFSYE